MIEATAHIGIAVYTTEAEVKSWMSGQGGNEYHPGAIYCEVPELGLEKPNLVYCRYGLSLPWIKVEPGDKLWVEPTIEGEHRWRYTGFADKGENDYSEPFVRGATFKTEFDKHIDLLTELQNALKNWSPVALDGGAALKTAVTTFCTKMLAESSEILSERIIGE